MTERTQTSPTREEMEQFLKTHKWRRDPDAHTSWCWRQPGTHSLWRLRDAYELEHGLASKQHVQ
jgi:hypothetical protein